MTNNTSKKVYIIILNWNGWEDTIECLESVFRNSYSNYSVIVCDNASTDNSLQKIKEWANGQLIANQSNKRQISVCTMPPVPKPINYVEYNRKQAEQGGYKEEQTSLILIQTGGNLGFAGGNNVGMRYALARDDFEYIWLLNNDTVIEEKALVHLVKRMEINSLNGMCGSTLLFYDHPDIVQALGGAVYNKWVGVSKHIGQNLNIMSGALNKNEINLKLDYIVGASMLVSGKMIKDIGLMCEDYFLYFEELDWAVRSRDYYKLVYSNESIVYHKEGATIGGKSNPKFYKSRVADYYGIKNRITFTMKYYKYLLPCIYLGLFISIINRIRRKQWDRIIMILKIMRDTIKDMNK